MLFSHKESAPSEPPSYEQSQDKHNSEQGNADSDPPPEFVPSDPNSHSQYGNLGPNEYPEEKKRPSSNDEVSGGNYANNNYKVEASSNGIPPGTYVVPPQTANIAYDTQGTSARPGYKEFLEKDNQRIAQGDFPKPRSFFGRKGAPLAPSKKGGSSGGFPGASNTTYYDASKGQ